MHRPDRPNLARIPTLVARFIDARRVRHLGITPAPTAAT
jgi:hypothetical protein